MMMIYRSLLKSATIGNIRLAYRVLCSCTCCQSTVNQRMSGSMSFQQCSYSRAPACRLDDAANHPLEPAAFRIRSLHRNNSLIHN